MNKVPLLTGSVLLATASLSTQAQSHLEKIVDKAAEIASMNARKVQKLANEGQYQEACKNHLSVVGATNLLAADTPTAQLFWQRHPFVARNLKASEREILQLQSLCQGSSINTERFQALADRIVRVSRHE